MARLNNVASSEIADEIQQVITISSDSSSGLSSEEDDFNQCDERVQIDRQPETDSNREPQTDCDTAGPCAGNYDSNYNRDTTAANSMHTSQSTVSDSLTDRKCVPVRQGLLMVVNRCVAVWTKTASLFNLMTM